LKDIVWGLGVVVLVAICAYNTSENAHRYKQLANGKSKDRQLYLTTIWLFAFLAALGLLFTVL
jgi:hypothetical protein